MSKHLDRIKALIADNAEGRRSDAETLSMVLVEAGRARAAVTHRTTIRALGSRMGCARADRGKKTPTQAIKARANALA